MVVQTAIWVRAAALAEQMFQLGEDLFDRIEVGGVFRQEKELGTGLAETLADRRSLVAAQIVQHDHVSRSQCRRQHVVDVNKEVLGIHRSIEQPGRFEPVVAQGGHEGHRVPASVRSLALQPFPTWCPSAQRRHVSLGPGLVDEDQAGGINPPLIASPLSAAAGDVGAILLAGAHGFF